MASGKKNYFRHDFMARKHPKIVSLIEKHGKEAYYHFFALVELCSAIASDEMPNDITFHFHPRTLCSELLVKKWTLISHLMALHQSRLCRVTVDQQQITCRSSADAQQVSVCIPNLPKFLGRYETNSSNKRKEIKENKLKEIKAKQSSESELNLLMTPDEIVNLWNQTMPSDIFPSAKSLYSSKNMKLVIECDSLLRKLNLNWLDIFQRIRSSTKLNGADTGFVYIPDVSFCIKPENIEALVNGKYDTPSNEHLKELEKREADKRAFLGL